MKKYTFIKEVSAEQMDRNGYSLHQGYSLPKNGGEDEGYLIEEMYHGRSDVSWVQKDEFEKYHSPVIDEDGKHKTAKFIGYSNCM